MRKEILVVIENGRVSVTERPPSRGGTILVQTKADPRTSEEAAALVAKTVGGAVADAIAEQAGAPEGA